jgi:hypothetical protein
VILIDYWYGSRKKGMMMSTNDEVQRRITDEYARKQREKTEAVLAAITTGPFELSVKVEFEVKPAVSVAGMGVVSRVSAACYYYPDATDEEHEPWVDARAFIREMNADGSLNRRSLPRWCTLPDEVAVSLLARVSDVTWSTVVPSQLSDPVD